MTEKELSAVEAELYDRQIRLWGIESQERLRAANVLLINIRGVGSEIAKNILLSGVNSLTILDDGTVTEEEQVKNFLLPSDSKGQKIAEAVLPKAQALNPLVKITADTENPYKKDKSFFENFMIIVGTGLKADLLFTLDRICRSKNIKLIVGDVFGMFGYLVADFQKHNYFEEQVQYNKKRSHDGAEKATIQKEGCIEYPELEKILIFPNTKQKADSIKKCNRRNELFFVMLVLLEFRNRNNRNPEIQTKDQDIAELQNIKNEITELYNVKNDIFSNNLLQLLFGEVCPVSAILGGVIAQEVIKALSRKEVPINNVFLFDPVTFNGKEECVAA